MSTFLSKSLKPFVTKLTPWFSACNSRIPRTLSTTSLRLDSSKLGSNMSFSSNSLSRLPLTWLRSRSVEFTIKLRSDLTSGALWAAAVATCLMQRSGVSSSCTSLTSREPTFYFLQKVWHSASICLYRGTVTPDTPDCCSSILGQRPRYVYLAVLRRPSSRLELYLDRVRLAFSWFRRLIVTYFLTLSHPNSSHCLMTAQCCCCLLLFL